MDTDDLAEDASDKVDTLIDLLIEKGLISEEEMNKRLDGLYEDEESSE